ncbi:MAG: MipA/OmpV family protein [Deltaproteobacteria bacterium HGW-Deltaproteobacteria-2]|jgi:outer membrane scaffolding protein for murein synthesis (MipA/OmpV family)|nr:MAG: MipA/OmpV family protein [Deltaproteobacteria bacterium HGW-Deltaproteobacteria-2]
MRIRYRVIIALLLLSFLLPVSAICEEKPLEKPPGKPLWELGVGLGLLQMPDYRGSDENRLYLLPYPYLVYRGDFLKVDEQRITGQIFKTDRILLDFSGFGAVPVKSSDNSARNGMEDLDATFELGPALKIKLWESKEDKFKLSLSLPVRAFFSTDFSSVRREGWVFSPRINFVKDDLIPETGLNLGISVGPMFADSGYHAYYYTVEPAYATPARPAYSAGGGYSGSTLTVGLGKSYKQFNFNAFVSTDFLQGASFEDSPLVKRETSIMSGVSVSWVFFKSAKTVNVEK